MLITLRAKRVNRDHILLYGYNSTRALIGCFLVKTEHY